jgi:Anion-transporting ATPase
MGVEIVKVVHSGGISSHEAVRAWWTPSPIGFLDHPTRSLVFTGKGGVGKTSLSAAAELTLADAGRQVQAGAAGRHRRGIQPRRDARHRALQLARSCPCRHALDASAGRPVHQDSLVRLPAPRLRPCLAR